MPVDSDLARLSSLRAQLDELTERVTALGDEYRDTSDSGVAVDLDAAERALLTAGRALGRAAGGLADLRRT